MCGCGAHVHRCAFSERHWAEAIEETPRTNEPPFSDRQSARNGQRAKIDLAIRVNLQQPMLGTKRNTFLGRNTF